MKKIIFTLLLGFYFLILPQHLFATTSQKYEATITEISQEQVLVRIEEGTFKGQQFHVMLFDQKQIAQQQIKKGDSVLVSMAKTAKGKTQVMIVDQVRKIPLAILTVLFVGVVIFIGKLKGVTSLLAMIASFAVIVKFVIPQILLGNDPLLISLLGALLIIPLTFYISHGIKKHTTVAVVSTFLALIVTGVLSYVFVIATRLTGFAAEEATFIQAIRGESINIQSLLLAGIMIGAMGVLDDITISQTSIVEKLWKANPKYTKWHVFTEAMDVGRDHIASLVNTLILVYAGAALPLFGPTLS